ncbi:uncharacterized protein MYCFIDRAFT_75292 [Pseudocercospora fijiensis CIRAD86]|uniref:Uncharacterized protein n=1 Tax=Pseudocercospora fijiensis (strain CIRAD86) TaxID=383855 RepID=N1Q5U4_PSEFD|nr:uncharacterized protein MYCFIDRAFT_75292 [Pseudocercospora fijiensis CIRAD86]EME87435.1 hypothetical protein MYCFIDRAFT_75292 [Pseudocercospora fijiensis CIRAD86]
MAATNQAQNVAALVALTDWINRLNLGPAVHVAPEQAAKLSKKNKKKSKKKKKEAEITPPKSAEAKQKTKEELAAEREAEIVNVLNFFDERYHSKSTKLEAYQTFCEDLGVEVGPSIRKCKKILSQVFVNICDLVVAKQGKTLVHRFPTATQLRKYSKATEKFFPLKRAKEDTVLHELLIHMHR